MKRNVKRHAVVQPPDESIRLIPLTQGQNTVVDVSKYAWLMQWTWFTYWNPCTKSFYAYRKSMQDGKRINLAMHRELLGLTKGEFADHRNHDTLDNRLTNLRKCTRSENMQNRRTFSNNKTGEPGVYWHSRDQCWSVYINYGNHRTWLGYYDDYKKAVAARRTAVLKYHGAFAYPNHLSTDI